MIKHQTVTCEIQFNFIAQNEVCTIRFRSLKHEVVMDGALCSFTAGKHEPACKRSTAEALFLAPAVDESVGTVLFLVQRHLTSGEVLETEGALDWQLRDCFLYGEVAIAGASSDVHSAGWACGLKKTESSQTATWVYQQSLVGISCITKTTCAGTGTWTVITPKAFL